MTERAGSGWMSVGLGIAINKEDQMVILPALSILCAESIPLQAS